MTASRRMARVAAVCVLFAALAAADDAKNVLQKMRQHDDKTVKALDDEWVDLLVNYFDDNKAAVEKNIGDNLSRPLQNISRVERAILSAAIGELILFPQTAADIIINEAIEIAKKYGAEGGHKLVNGVLDSFVKNRRP